MNRNGIGYSRKNPNGGGGGLRIWNFQGYRRNSMWDLLQGLIKTKWNFQGWPRKNNNVEFPGVYMFLALKFWGCNTILCCGSKGKVKKWKIPGSFSKEYYIFTPSPPHPFGLGFFWNSPMQNGLFLKNPNRGLRIWDFQGYQRNSMWNLQGFIKDKVVEFPGFCPCNFQEI